MYIQLNHQQTKNKVQNNGRYRYPNANFPPNVIPNTKIGAIPRHEQILNIMQRAMIKDCSTRSFSSSQIPHRVEPFGQAAQSSNRGITKSGKTADSCESRVSSRVRHRPKEWNRVIRTPKKHQREDKEKENPYMHKRRPSSRHDNHPVTKPRRLFTKLSCPHNRESSDHL